MSLSQCIEDLIGFVQACGPITPDVMPQFRERDRQVYVEALRIGRENLLPGLPDEGKRTMHSLEAIGKTNLPGKKDRDGTFRPENIGAWRDVLMILCELGRDARPTGGNVESDDKESELWVDQKTAAEIEGVTTNSLRTMRSHAKATRAQDGMSGMDKTGRKWRKESHKSQIVQYYGPSLRGWNKVSRDNSKR